MYTVRAISAQSGAVVSFLLSGKLVAASWDDAMELFLHETRHTLHTLGPDGVAIYSTGQSGQYSGLNGNFGFYYLAGNLSNR